MPWPVAYVAAPQISRHAVITALRRRIPIIITPITIRQSFHVLLGRVNTRKNASPVGQSCRSCGGTLPLTHSVLNAGWTTGERPPGRRRPHESPMASTSQGAMRRNNHLAAGGKNLQEGPVGLPGALAFSWHRQGGREGSSPLSSIQTRRQRDTRNPRTRFPVSLGRGDTRSIDDGAAAHHIPGDDDDGGTTTAAGRVRPRVRPGGGEAETGAREARSRGTHRGRGTGGRAAERRRCARRPPDPLRPPAARRSRGSRWRTRRRWPWR